MKDANLARRMRITNGLMVALFLVGACVVALIAGDLFAGLSGMALFSLSWAAAVLWMDHPALLPGGRLSIREKRVLQVALPVTFGLGFCATVLAVGNAHTAAVIVLAVAGVLAIATGAFSVWLAVRAAPRSRRHTVMPPSPSGRMKYAKLAPRIRIAGVLMTAGFLSLSWKLVLLAGDRLTGLLQAASLSLLWPSCVLLLDHFTSVPGGELSVREKRVLRAALLVIFGLGLCAAVLAMSNADPAAAIVAAIAGIIAVAAGALSVWLTIRFVGVAYDSITSREVADETPPPDHSSGKRRA